MKKILIAVMAIVIATVFTVVPKNANADVLYAENFEDGVANGLYAWWGGWWVAEEGGNHFYRSTSSSSDYLLSTIQTFPDVVSIEFMSRSAIANHSQELMGSNWQWIFWTVGTTYGQYGYYAGQLIDGGTGTWSMQPNQWYDMEITLISGLATFYIDSVFITEYNIGAYGPLDNFNIAWLTWGQRDLDNITVNLVPEPATMLLLGSGLIGLAGYGRKKFFKK